MKTARRLPLILLFVIVLIAAGGLAYWRFAWANRTQAVRYTNPILNQDFPDPSVLQAPDGWYYAYATQTETMDLKRINFQVARSKDLVNWEHLGDALPEKPTWASRTWDFWAPHVIYADGKYFMYYSADPNTGNGLCLAVATAAAPTGPFQDKGEPLACGYGFVNIDPMAFDDPKTGKHYLYWGSNSQPIRVQELADDRMNFKPGTRPKYALLANRARPYEDLIEGAWVIYRNDTYYLFYSGDACCGPSANYAVMVARAKDPLGPFERLGDVNGTRESMILVKNDTWTAPGHNAILTDAAGQDWIFYHAIKAKVPTNNDPNPNDDYYPRVMLMDRVIYQDGWPVIPGKVPSTTEQEGPKH